MGKYQGLERPAPYKTPSATPVAKRALPTESEYNRLVADPPGPFPLLNPGVDCPGLLGRLAHYISTASVMATESGGLAVALPVMGALFGRHYQTDTGLHPSVYTVSLGSSGSGKSSIIKPARVLLERSGCSDLIGQDRMGSGQGLLKMLEEYPERVCFLDEFGHMLQQITDAGTSSHVRQILTEMTQLYSFGDMTYRGTAYANKEPVIIERPNLCIFGMATPGQFWGGFSSRNLEDGSLARFLIVPLGLTESQQPNPQGMDNLKKEIRALRKLVYRDRSRSRKIDADSDRSEPCVAKVHEDVQAVRKKLSVTMTDCASFADEHGIRGAPSILRRVVENSMRIALISAVGRDPENPVIDMDDWDIGHSIARWSAETAISGVKSYVADNQVEKNYNRVERKIKKAGKKGIVKGALKNQLRSILNRDIEDILNRLFEADCIRSTPLIPQRGPKTQTLYWKK